MKKTVLTFGALSGLFFTVNMLLGIRFLNTLHGNMGLIVGYTTMVLAGLLIFFGIRSYRENVSGGTVTFLRALVVGLLISLISSCFYVGTWEFIYYKYMPHFPEKYAAEMIEHAKSSGVTPDKVAQITEQAERFARNYHNPAYVTGMTFLEVLPVFLVMTLLSAAILRRKSTSPQPAVGGIRQVA